MNRSITASLAALALSVPASAQKPTTVVPVDMHSFGFNPSPISLRALAPVTLVFTNSAGTSHEFKSPAFFRSAKIVSGDVGEDGSVELKPHSSSSVTLIPVSGTYSAHCGHFGHALLGMRTTIYVQ